jgi:hypothetical protein
MLFQLTQICSDTFDFLKALSLENTVDVKKLRVESLNIFRST